MEIAVDGWRGSTADWDAVRSLPVDQLPPLTKEQREVAKKLGVREEDYARSVLAGERNQDVLLEKTERLARLLRERLEKGRERAQVARVVLRTNAGRFDVELDLGGRRIHLRIDEAVVDSYFDSGSADAEATLSRILDRALAGVTQ